MGDAFQIELRDEVVGVRPGRRFELLRTGHPVADATEAEGLFLQRPAAPLPVRQIVDGLVENPLLSIEMAIRDTQTYYKYLGNRDHYFRGNRKAGLDV